MAASIYAMSDIHGHRAVFERVLYRAGLVSAAGAWTGGRAALWLLGDYVDRGPNGIGVIERIMQLQDEAAAAGGEVVALLGNHEVLLLGAFHFRGQGAAGERLLHAWQRNGGLAGDLQRLRARHVVWLTFLPALLQRGDWLLAHADSRFYAEYGHSRDAVNEAIKQVLLGDDAAELLNLTNWFTGRLDFLDRYDGSEVRLEEFLGWFGGRRLIHGHTPVDALHGIPPEAVTEAYVYQGGRCVNIDGGLFRGGPGLLHRVAGV